MTEKDLKKANELQKEIQELECFIQRSENLWTGKIIKRESYFIFKVNAYGTIDSAEFNMNTAIKDKVLDVLREQLGELKQQLKNI